MVTDTGDNTPNAGQYQVDFETGMTLPSSGRTQTPDGIADDLDDTGANTDAGDFVSMTVGTHRGAVLTFDASGSMLTSGGTSPATITLQSLGSPA
ncbi:hypothetical protein [Dongshaea marina]|uniref:hypothetical protein n=1 Tax=Dongshaea marina TaxID=2047966 RepID=UPI0018FFD040|nr:hypothetical protein [Dongshaea marina]